MGIASSVELGRTVDLPLGDPAVAKRTWVCTLTDNTLQGNPLSESEVFTALGLTSWYDAHPSFSALYIRRIVITERYGDSPYHVEVVAEYGPTTPNEVLIPTNRAAEWSFQAQPSEVPALFYYHGTDNADIRPLTNSAYDYIQGLTTSESMVKATIKKNFASFPTSQMAATNFINSEDYFGGGQYTWKCAGVNTSLTIELFNNNNYTYWATQTELIYRQSGWRLQIPDVGWNFLSGGEKRRAMVFDFKNGEWIPSPNPVALDGYGSQVSGGAGQPAILYRRVNPAADFSSLFGDPPP